MKFSEYHFRMKLSKHKKENNKKQKNQKINLCQKNHL